MNELRLLRVGKWLAVSAVVVLLPVLLGGCNNRPVLAQPGKPYALKIQLKEAVTETAYLKLVAFTSGSMGPAQAITLFGKTYTSDASNNVVFSKDRVMLQPKDDSFELTVTPSAAIAGQAFIVAAYEVDNATDEPDYLDPIGFGVFVVDDAPGARPLTTPVANAAAGTPEAPAFTTRAAKRGGPGKVKTPIGISTK